jgi:hypothetical protein
VVPCAGRGGGRVTRRKSSAHVVLRGDAIHCTHCGEQYTPAMPCPVHAWSAMVEAFSTSHIHCQAPAVNVCVFCRMEDHTDDDHINATTTRPEQWPSCGDVGMSSRAIWRHMMGRSPDVQWGPRPPSDPADFGRCYRLLHAPWAGEWRERIGEMAKYHGWSGLVARWAELETLYIEERPTGEGPKLWAAMKECEGAR